MNDPTINDASDVEHLRAEIEHTREELSHHVEAIADTVTVKQHAPDRVPEPTTAVTDVVTHVRESAPPAVQHVLDNVGTKAAPVMQQAAPYRKQIVLGVLGAVALLLIGRRLTKGGLS